MAKLFDRDKYIDMLARTTKRTYYFWSRFDDKALVVAYGFVMLIIAQRMFSACEEYML